MGAGLKILLDLQGLQSKSRERGIGRLTRSLAHAILDEAGPHDIHVLLSEDLAETPDTVHSEFSARLPAGHVHWFGPYGQVAERNITSQWRARAAALLREAQIAKLRPDIVHVGSLFEGFLDDTVTSIGRLQADHATAATLYDLIPLADPESYFADSPYRACYMRHAQDLKRADLLLSISAHSKREAMLRLHIPEERIAVIHAGVDPQFRPNAVTPQTKARLRRRLGTDDRFLLYVGAADPRKNVALILDAYMCLSPDLRAGISLAFVGRLSDDERSFVLRAGHVAGVPGHKIILLDLIDDDNLAALYVMCDALVFPSTNEGFGLPPLEAMACGAPTLVADATSLPEVVGRSDCLFDPYDARSLADRIVRLSDSGWRRDLCLWGPRRARDFSWAAAGRKALEAFERTVPVPRQGGGRSDVRRRPRMAFVSPLPPDQSGIADDSAILLRELLVYYEIDCIHPKGATSDPWIVANCGMQDLGWFDAHADRYDRILYSIANSSVHDHLIPRLTQHPGVVILHDAGPSSLAVDGTDDGETPTDGFVREIYASHGLACLRRLRDHGRQRVVADLAMNGSVFRNAQGVIVESVQARDLAEKTFGPMVRRSISVVPYMRRTASPGARTIARRALSLSDDDFLVCCFVTGHARELHREVADAFIAANLSDRASWLAFVWGPAPIHGSELEAAAGLATPGANIRFVGRADGERYDHYLQAADVAVQLRADWRGGASRPILNFMAQGLPVIVSDIGPSAGLPDDAVVKVPVNAPASTLAAHLLRLRQYPDVRHAIGDRARDYIERVHHPYAIGLSLHAAIEGYATTSRLVGEQTLITAFGDIKTHLPLQADDLDWAAAQMQALSSAPRLRQILVDVSAIGRIDARTGVERVVRAVLERLVTAPPSGFRIEPTILENGIPVYARAFVEERLGLPMGGLPSTPVVIGAGDHFLALDGAPHDLPEAEAWLGRFRRQGGTVTIVVHDPLPLAVSIHAPAVLYTASATWSDLVVRTADVVACVSQTVADSVVSLASSSRPERTEPLAVGVFHPGSDIGASCPTTGLPADAAAILVTIGTRPTFLVLGTVEQRKGHAQVIAAFDALWGQGLDVGLVIVGKEGRHADDIVAAIQASPRFGTQLTWLPNISDDFLEQVFDASAALIVASFGEGFSLPIVEAGRHGLPVIVRDVPVFRDVAGDHAFYFAGGQPADLAETLRRWLDLRGQQRIPDSSKIVRVDWADATDQLVAIMFGERRLVGRGSPEAVTPVLRTMP